MNLARLLSKKNHEIRVLCSASPEALQNTKKGKHPAMLCVNTVDAYTMFCLREEEDVENMSCPAGGVAGPNKTLRGISSTSSFRGL
jgi:hypothetical protein